MTSNEPGDTPPPQQSSSLPLRLVSYAQNFEDVMLWRALAEVPNGTYIDVGAAWPVADSVTKLFYDRGWSGLNIEPNPALYTQLTAHRDRDINVCLAAGSEPGSAVLNVVLDSGLSTLVTDLAQDHSEAGHEVAAVTIEVRTLAELWDTHLGTEREVHFLKVDVEGFEKQVIEGNDWTRHRPWLLVIEATLPTSQVMAHASWEKLIINADYKFVYADGLNRFYVAAEHSDLEARFEFPPNVFDGFVPSAQTTAEDAATQSATEAAHHLLALDFVRQELQINAARASVAEDRGATIEQELAEARREFATARRSSYLEIVGHRIAADAAAGEAESALAALSAALRDRTRELEEALHARDAHRRQVVALEQSTSWRLTRPVRALSGFITSPGESVHRAAQRLFSGATRPILNMTIDRATPLVRDNPRVRSVANSLLARAPALRARLLAITHQRGLVTLSRSQNDSGPTDSSDPLPNLTTAQYLALFRAALPNDAEDVAT